MSTLFSICSDGEYSFAIKIIIRTRETEKPEEQTIKITVITWRREEKTLFDFN